jgi:exodeoxyribonuclease III
MKKLQLYSWNINGIRAAYKKGILDWIDNVSPDILCLQETKAHPDQLPGALKEIDGYQIFFTSAERKGYSGVAVYTKPEPSQIQHGFGIDIFDSEGRTIVVDYGDFILFNVYFPNGKASAERLKYKMDFYDAFLNHLDSLLKEGRKIVICGDVNTAHKEIDLARPKENEKTSGFLPEERAWIDKLLEHGFVDTFRIFNDKPDQYSWWDMKSRARDRNVGWRIDYFYISENLRKNVTNAEIHQEVMGSDHCPISLELSI